MFREGIDIHRITYKLHDMLNKNNMFFLTELAV